VFILYVHKAILSSIKCIITYQKKEKTTREITTHIIIRILSSIEFQPVRFPPSGHLAFSFVQAYLPPFSVIEKKKKKKTLQIVVQIKIA
jgi:hypothetical protein